MLNSLVKLKAHAARTNGSDRLAKLLDEKKRRFSATLTHVMVNENGHELTIDEARQACKNFNKSFPIRMAQGPIKDPSDLHPTSSGEIIGRVIGLELIENDGDPRIDYVGEVYNTIPFTEHAYQLIKDSVFEFDSFEVDYEYGECSTCGTRFKNKNEICSHLTVRQGMVVGTNRGHVIMHGVIFKGVALLDRPGGDPRAKVRAVATLLTEEKSMAETKTKDEKKESHQGGSEEEALQAKVTDLENRVKELEEENKGLRSENEAYRAKDREVRVDKIVAAKEKRGAAFDEKSRKAEIKRLMAKTDEQLSDIEEELESIPAPDPKEKPEDDAGDEEGDTKDDAPAKAEAIAQAKKSLAAKASAPAVVPDPTGETETENAVADLIAARRERKLK